MFLHKKASKPTKKALVLPLKFQIGTTSEDLRNTYNVEITDNGLHTRFNQSVLKFPAPLHYAVGTLDDHVYVMTSKGLCSKVNDTNWIFMVKKDGDVCSTVYRDNLIVSGKDYGTYLVKEYEATSLHDDGFSSVTCCADRIFGLYKNQVSYTAAGKADGWEQGQTVTLPSECQALASVGNKVYALGNDCYMLVPDGSDLEFKVVPLARNVGAVAKKSVVNYLGAVVFATENGLYKLSGEKVTPICRQLNEVAQFGVSAGALFEGKYYLACVSKDSGEYVNDVIMCIDINSEQIVGMLQYGADSIVTTSKEIVTSNNGTCYSFGSGTYAAKYQVSNVDFATADKKFLDKLVIKTSDKLDITVRSETETRVYRLREKSHPQKIFLRDMGWKFSINLYSQSGLDVQDVTLYAHTCEEV